MKSVMLMFMMVSFCANSAEAQGIFNQKGSQLKRLSEQVALLRTYSKYVKQGYRIARTGLNTINDIKQGDFNIHKTFFGSLKAVNPAIRNYSKVGEILLFQFSVLLSSNKAIAFALKSGMYDEADLENFNRVFKKIIADCSRILNALEDLVKDSRLELKDDERIHRIDRLHEEMLSIYVFNEDVCKEIVQVSGYKDHEGKRLEIERELHEVVKE